MKGWIVGLIWWGLNNAQGFGIANLRGECLVVSREGQTDDGSTFGGSWLPLDTGMVNFP